MTRWSEPAAPGHRRLLVSWQLLTFAGDYPPLRPADWPGYAIWRGIWLYLDGRPCGSVHGYFYDPDVGGWRIDYRPQR